jgi:putative inorganic carbon (hco3(-)) transporter
MADKTPTVEDFYIFKVGAMWRYFKKEHFSFWMICGYMVAEFVRPQAMFPSLQVIPWAQLLLMGLYLGRSCFWWEHFWAPYWIVV